MLLPQFLQATCIEESLDVDFLEAVEFIEGLILDDFRGEDGIVGRCVVAHFVNAKLQETCEIGHFGGIPDGTFHGIVLREDETVYAVGSAGEPGVFLAVQGSVEADVHGRVVGIGKYISGREFIQTPVAKLDGDDGVEGATDGFKGARAVQDGADVEELLHYLHGEGLIPFEERDARGMRGEGGEFVAQHVF